MCLIVSLVGDDEYLSAQAFQKFLLEEQGTSEVMVAQLLLRYEPDKDLAAENKLSYDGFYLYLTSKGPVAMAL